MPDVDPNHWTAHLAPGEPAPPGCPGAAAVANGFRDDETPTRQELLAVMAAEMDLPADVLNLVGVHWPDVQRESDRTFAEMFPGVAERFDEVVADITALFQAELAALGVLNADQYRFVYDTTPLQLQPTPPMLDMDFWQPPPELDMDYWLHQMREAAAVGLGPMATSRRPPVTSWRPARPDETPGELTPECPVVTEPLAGPAAQPRCCEFHNRNCEPPSELCCERCTEAAHGFLGRHADGSHCIAPDLSGYGPVEQL